MYSVQNPKVDITAKNATTTPKGEQNEGRYAADTQGGNAGRNSVLPEVREEHGRQVGIARSRILAADDSPPRLKAALQEGKGLIHEAEIKQSPKQDASIKTLNRLVSADLNRTLPANVFTQVLLESPITNIEKIARVFGKEIVWLKVNDPAVLHKDGSRYTPR